MKPADCPENDEITQTIDLLRPFVTPERFLKFTDVLRYRTRHLTVVLEDIYQPHNASAVLRTCDCFGIQDVHIIENRNKYEVNPDVALGSSKWLTLKKYHGLEENTTPCLKALKQQGYRLIATTPHKNDYTPATFCIEKKTALLFGTELSGLSTIALELADDFIRIPMVGFTESLNISVSAATLIHALSDRLRSASISWQLTTDEKNIILLEWLKTSIRKSDIILRDFQNRIR